MRIKQSFTAALVVLTTVLAAAASADTIYTGGDIRLASSWNNGLPTALNSGFISIDSTVAGNFNGAFANATITQSAGTLQGTVNANSAGLVYNLTGGTINNPANFNANSGSIFNLTGGQVNFGADILVNSSTGGISVGGDAVITTASDFDLRLNQDNAFFTIASDWTGALVSGTDVTEADWIAQLVFGAGPAGLGTNNVVNSLRQIDVDGVAIDQNNFADFFAVTTNAGGGSTLTLVAVPEPSSLAVLGLGALGFVTRRRRS